MADKPKMCDESSMVDESKMCDENFFEGLSLHGKEFMLPNISNPWLLEEFVVTPHFLLKSNPNDASLDSFIQKTLAKPSIPLVESVELFSLGLIDSPIGYSGIKSSTDFPMEKPVCHGRETYMGHATKSDILAGSSCFHNFQSHASASKEDSQISAKHPYPSSVKELSVPDAVIGESAC